MVIQTDKNCGPALIDKSYYIEQILLKHLGDGITYQQLTTSSATFLLSKFKSALTNILLTQKHSFSPIVKNYFTHGLKNATRIPVFYGTAKVHKGVTPDVLFRPIISQCGSLSALVSTYIDV